MTRQLLEAEHICCSHKGRRVVDQFSLHLNPGSINCLLGPSGCGKTTVLRAIAGFHALDEGVIRLQGSRVSSPGYTSPPERRGLGMVFQDYALFPHLNVAQNVAFGLGKVTPNMRAERVESLLELVGLEGYQRRYPHELSGGQQQRVALVRALATRPQLLLLDEPFSNLDVELRERLALDIRRVLQQERTAALFVTHDQREAFLLGEHVGIMRDGRLQQWDTPFNLYHEPVNRFVADFIGEGRMIRGRLVKPDLVQTSLGAVAGNRAYNWPAGSDVELLLRPDDVHISTLAAANGRVVDRAFRGAETLYTLHTDSGEELLSLMPSSQEYSPGEPVSISLRVEHLVLFQTEHPEPD